MAAHSVRMLETDSRKRAQESALETLLLRQISFRPYSYSLMSRELALLMICPVASLMKSTAMFSTSVPLKILYIPPYRYLRYRGNYHPGGCTAVWNRRCWCCDRFWLYSHVGTRPDGWSGSGCHYTRTERGIWRLCWVPYFLWYYHEMVDLSSWIWYNIWSEDS